VSRCKDGLQPGADKTTCVPIPSLVQQLITNTGTSDESGPLGPLRLNARQKRQDVFSTVATPNSDLRAQIQAVVNFVVDLNEVAHSIPAPEDTPAVDYMSLVQSTVDATVNLLNSNTVSNVIANVNALVNTNSDFKEKLSNCACVDNLGLGVLLVKLDAVLNSALNLQRWCERNPVGIPVLPEGSELGTALPAPIPNTSDLALDLDLDALLEVLSRLTSPANLLTKVDAVAHIDASVLDKVSALAQLVLDLSNGASLPPAPTGSAPIPIPIVGTPELPVDASLAQAIVQATVNLLGSSTVPSVLTNIDALVNVNAIVANALANCGCIEGMELGNFVGILDTVGQAAIDLKNNINLDADLLGTVNLDVKGLLADLLARLNIVGDVTANLELQNKIDALVKLVIALQGKTFAIPSLLPSIPSMPTPGLPNKNMLGGIVRATTSLLGSVTVPEFVANIDALVNANVLLGKMLNGCRCVEALGLNGVQQGVEGVSQAATDLQQWCATNTIADPSSPNTIVANAEVLATALGAVSGATST
jgi:hypothetical protein